MFLTQHLFLKQTYCLKKKGKNYHSELNERKAHVIDGRASLIPFPSILKLNAFCLDAFNSTTLEAPSK